MRPENWAVTKSVPLTYGFAVGVTCSSVEGAFSSKCGKSNGTFWTL